MCLLLLFCAAVLCASISISPWYKSESFLLRKTIVALSAGAALVTEKIAGKHIIQQGEALDDFIVCKREVSWHAVRGTKQTVSDHAHLPLHVAMLG